MSAVTHVCDCGVVWRLTVLGAQPLRTGARVFCGEGRRGERGVGRVSLLCVCDALSAAQIWPIPGAVYGLSSGVVMVAAGGVRARVVCCGQLWELGMWARCCVARLPRIRAVAPASWTGCEVDAYFGVCVRCVMECSDAVSAWALCDVLWN